MVSVVMSVYNEEKFIAEAIESVLGQTYSNFEFIIINDGSTDNTDEIIKGYSDKRIRYFSDGLRKNQAQRANEGIALAKGQYVARMDGDDISLPQRFERQVEYFERNHDIQILGTQIRTILNSEHKSYRYKELPLDPDVLKFYSKLYCPFIHSSVMARRQVFLDYQYNPSFTIAQDFELFSRILLNENGANLAETHVHYRVHDNNVHLENRERLIMLSAEIIESRLQKEGLHLSANQKSIVQLIMESNNALLNRNNLKDIHEFTSNKEIELNDFNRISAYIWRELYWKLEKSALPLYLKYMIANRAYKKMSVSDAKYLIKQYLKIVK